MRTLSLSDHPAFTTCEPAHFPEHTFFTAARNEFQLPEHRSAFALVGALEGSYTFSLNGRNHVMDTGSFLLVNQNSHIALLVHRPAQPFVLCFHSAIADGNPSDWALTERIYAATDAFNKRIRTLASLPESCSSFITMQSDSIIRSILFDIAALNRRSSEESRQLEFQKASTRQDVYKRLISVRNWMEENYAKPLTLDALAEVAAMNHQHFLRQFTCVFGKTPHQYIIDRRIAAAKRLLADATFPIADICASLGWSSAATFSTLFKRKTGRTPGEFRDLCRDHVL